MFIIHSIIPKISSLHASKNLSTTIMSVRVSPERNSIQSISTKEICILVALDDLTCYNIVSRMLQICTYKVLSTGNVDDVLNAMWERREHVSVVFTNVHRLSSGGFDILQNIKDRLNLQTIVMSPDDEKVAISEKGSSFVAYIVKFLNVNDINNLWQSALEIEKMECLKEKQGGEIKASGTTEGNPRTTSSDEVTRVRNKRCREESLDENEESGDRREDDPVAKKPRMIWTKEMHQKFVEAIEILGYEKAFPKKIVEIMDVPGLTRENVASHLQKYRMCLKRSQESDVNSLHGMNQTTAVRNQYLSSGVSTLYSKFSYGNSYLGRNLHGTYSQPPFRRTFPNVLYPSASMYPKSCQMDVRNLECIDGNGIMNTRYGYTPNIMLGRNFRVYNGPKKNVLMDIGGRSSLDANWLPIKDPCTSFLGFRLTSDGKSVEVEGKCISTSIQTTGSETLPNTLGNGNTNQLASTLNEIQSSLLSVEDYGYSEENLIQPPPLSANCTLGQEPLSEESSILVNEQINLYSPSPPENEYINIYSSTPDSICQQQSLLPISQTPSGISSAQSSTPDGTNLQQQIFMPLCQASDYTLAAQFSMPLDPILHKTPSPPLLEVLDNEISAQSSTSSGNFIEQHQYSVLPVPNYANVCTMQNIPTPSTQESPLPSLPSDLDEFEGILSGIGEDFWNNDFEDIINTNNF